MQVCPAPVRAARLVFNSQCRESNHDGFVASIDMRDDQQFRDTRKSLARTAPRRLRAGKDGKLVRSFCRRANATCKGFFHHSKPALKSDSTMIMS